MLPSIILTQEEVPLGARVYALTNEKEDTKQHYKGEPLILRAMLDEGGLIKKLYPIQNNIKLIDIPKNTKFFPVEVFSTKKAPDNARYAVFVNGKLVLPFEVAKSEHKRFYVSTGFPFKEHSNSGKDFFEKRIDELLLQLDLVESPDDYLIKELTKSKEEIGKRIVENGPLGTEVCNLERKSRLFFEVLARRHRHEPAEFIKCLEGIGTPYLKETPLVPYTTELVRVDYHVD